MYFAGVNSSFLVRSLIDRPIMVSFAEMPGDSLWRQLLFRNIAAGLYCDVVLDSGAYQAMTGTRRVELSLYAEFCEQYGGLFKWVANFDDIEDYKQSAENLAYLEDRVDSVVPVYHQGEPIEVLRDMVASHDRIGLGFQRPISGPEYWLNSLREPLWDGETKVHGFAMSRWVQGWPFESTDSTTWISEMRALRYGAPSNRCVGQAATVMAHLADTELLEMVLKSWERRQRAHNTVETVNQGDLFT